MPIGPNGERRPKDPNRLAHKIVQIATRQDEEKPIAVAWQPSNFSGDHIAVVCWS